MKNEIRNDELARNFARNIQKDLDAEVVVHPDHPLLFDSPDLLIALPGNLVGIFLLRVTELNSSDMLFARLAVSRLALPDNFRCILVIPEKLEDQVNIQLAARHFHEVLTSGDSRNLNKFIKDEKAKANIQDVPTKERQKAFKRFESLFNESLKYVRIDESNSKETVRQKNKQNSQKEKIISDKREELLAHLSSNQFNKTEIFNWKLLKQSPRFRESNRLLHEKERVVGLLSERKTNSTLEKIKPLCRDILQLSYEFDNGVPHFKRKTANLMIADSISMNRYDIKKPIRVSAFAGWVMTSDGEVNSVFEQLNKVDEIVNNLKI